MKLRLALPTLTLVVAAGMTGCTANAPAGQASIAVTSTDSTCELSAATAPAGALTFRVTNSGAAATEFYVYAADGETVVAEVENIGPGLAQDMSATLAEGSYITACKPGMTGDGIRADFIVTDSGVAVTMLPVDDDDDDDEAEADADESRAPSASVTPQN